MATQYEPIVKDATLNTTEQTPRNIADVLADGLANIANNVKPDGSDISIDVPGMSANNVDDGFSELKQSLDSLIGTGRIATTSPVTITPTLSGDVHIILFGRKALSECCVYMYDFWSTDFTLLAGSANHITLTKSAQSNSITVTSNTTNSIPYMIF